MNSEEMLRQNMAEIVPIYLKQQEIIMYLKMEIERIKHIKPEEKFYPIDKLQKILEKGP